MLVLCEQAIHCQLMALGYNKKTGIECGAPHIGLRTRSHCAICDYNLFLLVIGCTGTGENVCPLHSVNTSIESCTI